MATQRSEVQHKVTGAAKSRASSTRSTDPSPFSRPETSGAVTPEQIATAAYYKALARGFAPGQEMDDWLAAERELTTGSPTEKPSEKPTEN